MKSHEENFSLIYCRLWLRNFLVLCRETLYDGITFSDQACSTNRLIQV